MVERFTGSGNKRGELKLPKTNSFLVKNLAEVPRVPPRRLAKLRRFVPLGLPIEEKGSQIVTPYTNNVGCPRTPGHNVTPITKK